MPISSTGIASGLDVESLVAQLVQVDVVPASRRLALSEARYQSEISAYGSLKGALASLQSAAAAAATASQYTAMKASTSTYGDVTVSASDDALAGSYELEATALAEAHSLASPSSLALAAADSVVGTGTLTINIGSVTYDGSGNPTGFSAKSGSTPTVITIDDSNKTLEGIRDAINDSAAPVTAAIVFDGTSYRLTLTSAETGIENSISIDVDDSDSVDTDTSGLSGLAYNAAAWNQQETNKAVDASLKINGLVIESATNAVNDALSGVSLTVKKVTENPVTVTVSQDIAKAQAGVQGFIDGYNEFIQTLNDLTSYDAENQSSSVLTGDATIRNIARRIRSEINSAIAATGATYTNLAELGVTTRVSEGSLQLDASKLTSILESNASDVAVVLASLGTLSNANVAYVSATDATKVGDYAVRLDLVATSASLTSATSSVNPKNQRITFDLTVDGVTRTVDLNDSGGGNIDYDDIASLLTAQITTAFGSNVVNVTASDPAGGTLTFETVSQGSSSSISISNVLNDAGLFGISAASGTDGTSSYTGYINGASATYDEAAGTLTGAVGTAVEGLVLKVSNGATGDLGTVSYTSGIGSQVKTLLDSLLDDEGLIEARIDGLNSSIKDLEKQREALDYRAIQLEQRYRSQFNGLETLIAQLNTTQTYLSQALSGFVEPNTTLRK